MMKETDEIPTLLLQEFTSYLDKYLGLYYPYQSWSSVKKKIPEMARAFGYQNPKAWLQWILDQPVSDERITAIAQHLTIGETYFFRDSESLNYLRDELLTPLIQERQEFTRHLRIWSAAACTGEEPFSMAMIINDLIPDRSSWDISILGTDINTSFLLKANGGVYREWSLRSTPENVKNRYFTSHHDRFFLSPDIQQMVKFNYLNLVEDKYPSLMNGTAGNDIILCNNVLIYFSDEQIQRVIRQLANCLIEGGYLCVSAVEAPLVDHKLLKPVSRGRGNIFQKRTHRVMHTLPVSVSPYMPTKKQKQKLLNDVKPKDIQEVKKTETVFESTIEDLLNKSYQLYRTGNYAAVLGNLKGYYCQLKVKNDYSTRDFEVIKLLIRASANLGLLEESLSLTNIALEREQVDPILHYLHAAILQELSRPEEAVQSLKKALFLDSNFTIAYFTLGNILVTTENIEMAKKNFKNALVTMKDMKDEELVSEGEGLTVERLKLMIQHILERFEKENGHA